MLAYSTGVYDVLKLFHVLAAVIWVGGDVMIFILSQRLVKENDPAREVGFVRDLAVVGKRVIMPVSLTLIVFAVTLVIYDPRWTFTTTWIVLGILGYLATFVTGAFFLGPSAEKIERLLESGRPDDDPEIRGLIRKTMTVGRVDVVVLVLIVCDMVLKPGS